MFYDSFLTRFWRETDTFSSLHWPNWPRMTPLLTQVQPHRSRGRNNWTHGEGDATTHIPRLLCGLTEWRHTDLNHPLTPMTSNDHCSDRCTDHCTDHCLTTAQLCNHWAMASGVWWNDWLVYALKAKIGRLSPSVQPEPVHSQTIWRQLSVCVSLCDSV